MTDNIINALAVATRQWHVSSREVEALERALSDALARKHEAERDLHELGRVIELLASEAGNAAAGEAANLHSSVANGTQPTVTVPIVTPAPTTTPGIVLPGNQAPEDSPSEIVLQAMQARIGAGGVGG